MRRALAPKNTVNIPPEAQNVSTHADKVDTPSLWLVVILLHNGIHITDAQL